MKSKPFLVFILIGILTTIIPISSIPSLVVMGQAVPKTINGTEIPELVPPSESERGTPPPPSNESGLQVIFVNKTNEKKTESNEPNLGKNQTSSEKGSEDESQSPESVPSGPEGCPPGYHKDPIEPVCTLDEQQEVQKSHEGEPSISQSIEDVEVCDNGKDDDGDGKTDLADEDCQIIH